METMSSCALIILIYISYEVNTPSLRYGLGSYFVKVYLVQLNHIYTDNYPNWCFHCQRFSYDLESNVNTEDVDQYACFVSF